MSMGTGAIAREIARLRKTLQGRLRSAPTEAQKAAYDWYGQPSEVYPRARDKQRPPEGDWRAWFVMAGRAFGKTRCAAEWVRHKVERGEARRVHLVGATAADVRDVMIQGESGLLTISPPWSRPTYEPSKRRLTWPNGAVGLLFSSEEPDRLRGPQADLAWGDEIAAWPYVAAWDNLMMGLRLGRDPRVVVTTTPKPIKWIRDLIADPGTALVRGSTYENKANLAPTFFDSIIKVYEGTRLGLQELEAELLEVAEGSYFPTFDPARHVSAAAEFDHRYAVHLAIDCGVSRHVGAVWFQVRPIDQLRSRITVFGDAHIEGQFSEAAARRIKAHSEALPSRGQLDSVRLDPAADARTGVGPAAYLAFEREFGSRITGRWPRHLVQDGLDQLGLLLETGCLLIHPRAAHMKAAFLNYVRKPGRGGEWLDEPKDPNHPYEDTMDALRGGVRARFPEGLRAAPLQLRQIHASTLR